MNWIAKIHECFENNTVYYSRHAKFEMENEDFGRIYEHEVYEAISSGEVIEEYPDDRPRYGRHTPYGAGLTVVV